MLAEVQVSNAAMGISFDETILPKLIVTEELLSFAERYFLDESSQEIATPRPPAADVPVVVLARIDKLELSYIAFVDVSFRVTLEALMQLLFFKVKFTRGFSLPTSPKSIVVGETDKLQVGVANLTVKDELFNKTGIC